MKPIMIDRGTYQIGRTTTNEKGEVISETPPKWENDPDGGCVLLGEFNEEKNSVDDGSIYGTFMATNIMEDVFQRLGINADAQNMPPLIAIWKAAKEDGVDMCRDYCPRYGQRMCYECPLHDGFCG